MAQQLEAALRRAPVAESRPPVTDPLAASPAAEPPARATGRDYKLRLDPKFEAQQEARHEPTFGSEPDYEARPEPRFEPAPKPAVQKPTASKPPAPAGKTVYDSLEEEMASLLGRPPGKT